MRRIEAEHGSAEARPAHRPRADELVVLLEDPACVGGRRGWSSRSERLCAASARPRSAGTRRSGTTRRSAPWSSPSWKARSSPVSVTTPISAQCSSQRSITADDLRQRAPAATAATIRSWLSEIMISQGSIPGSRSGTRSRWTSTPAPSRAISASDDASPAAPQSWSDSTRPRSTSSSDTSISRLPVKGSPIWTDGRLSGVLLAELGAREHARAADPVAPGRRAEERRARARESTLARE